MHAPSAVGTLPDLVGLASLGLFFCVRGSCCEGLPSPVASHMGLGFGFPILCPFRSSALRARSETAGYASPPFVGAWDPRLSHGGLCQALEGVLGPPQRESSDLG